MEPVQSSGPLHFRKMGPTPVWLSLIYDSTLGSKSNLLLWSLSLGGSSAVIDKETVGSSNKTAVLLKDLRYGYFLLTLVLH